MGVVGLFFLLLFLSFLAYFFGGMLILKMRGANGLEVIPNYLFWITLPTKMKASLSPDQFKYFYKQIYL